MTKVVPVSILNEIPIISSIAEKDHYTFEGAVARYGSGFERDV
jgi:hypothetical protein